MILLYQSEVKLPTNTLPAVLIGLEESNLTTVIWAFRSMLFITFFYNEETIPAIIWNRVSSWVHYAQNIPLTHEASFIWEIPVRITKIRSWWFTLKTEGHICAIAVILWSLKKGGVKIPSDGWLSVPCHESILCVCTMYTEIVPCSSVMWIKALLLTGSFSWRSCWMP